MKISFIIPYHNEPIWMLKECIQSIITVHIDDEKEVIVVDDGSDVSPESELQQMNKALLQMDKSELLQMNGGIIIIRQDNGGLSAARNKGLEHATGDYIQFVDADDALLPSYADVIALLKKEKPSLLQFRLLRAEKMPENIAQTPIITGHKEPESIAQTSAIDAHPALNIVADMKGSEYIEHHNLRASACSYVFLRNIIGDDLRFERGIYHEDELFTPQLMLRAERLISISDASYFYRIREGSITNDKAKTMKKLDDMQHILISLKEKSLQTPSLQRRVHQFSMDYIYNIMMSGTDDKASRLLRMKQHKLFPLPLKAYTWKYFLFAILANIGIAISNLISVTMQQNKVSYGIII